MRKSKRLYILGHAAGSESPTPKSSNPALNLPSINSPSNSKQNDTILPPLLSGQANNKVALPSQGGGSKFPLIAAPSNHDKGESRRLSFQPASLQYGNHIQSSMGGNVGGYHQESRRNSGKHRTSASHGKSRQFPETGSFLPHTIHQASNASNVRSFGITHLPEALYTKPEANSTTLPPITNANHMTAMRTWSPRSSVHKSNHSSSGSVNRASQPKRSSQVLAQIIAGHTHHHTTSTHQNAQTGLALPGGYRHSSTLHPHHPFAAISNRRAGSDALSSSSRGSTSTSTSFRLPQITASK